MIDLSASLLRGGVGNHPHDPEAQQDLLRRLMMGEAARSIQGGPGHTLPSSSTTGGMRAQVQQGGGVHRGEYLHGLDKLLAQTPWSVGRQEVPTETVVLALRRPQDETPAGFQDSSVFMSREAQQRQNARIICWILRNPNNVWELSKQTFGCRIIQQALEVADRSVGNHSFELQSICKGADSKTMIAAGLQTHVIEALKDKCSNHVLQKCIEVLPRESTCFILKEIVEGNRAVEAAKNQYGCRVLQRLIEHFWDSKEELVEPDLKVIVRKLIDEDVRIHRQTLVGQAQVGDRLVNNKFANYVFQSLLEHGAWDSLVVTEVLAKDTLKLAEQKVASHVLSNVLTSGQNIEALVFEMLCSEQERPCLVKLEEFRNRLERNKWGSFIYKQVKKKHPELFVVPSENKGKGKVYGKGKRNDKGKG